MQKCITIIQKCIKKSNCLEIFNAVWNLNLLVNTLKYMEIEHKIYKAAEKVSVKDIHFNLSSLHKLISN